MTKRSFNKYETERDKLTPIAEFFSDLVDVVRDKIRENHCSCESDDCNSTKILQPLHPKDIIAMSAANIIVNLFLNASENNDPKAHAKMFEELLHEVNDFCIDSFKNYQHSQKQLVKH